MISSKIRYKFINTIVNDIYIRQNICSFPINLIDVINSLDIKIKVLSYSQFMYFYNIPREVVFDILTSDDGCCDYLSGKYVIYYNDLNNLPKERINWTIAHELGHILCNHYKYSGTKLFNSNLSEIEYEFLEKEANYFASMLLSHSSVLLQLDIHNPYEIEIFCNLSKQASKFRYENYLRWKKFNNLSSSDRYIIRNFQKYIDLKKQEYIEHLDFINLFNKKKILSY